MALGLLVVSHDHRAPVNRRFGLAALAIAGWIFSISYALTSADPTRTIILGRFGFAFASAIPFTLFWMFDAFSLSDTARVRHLRTSAVGLVCFAFICASFSPWIVAGAALHGERANFLYGPAHRIFGLYFLLCFLFAIYTLWNAIQSASGLRKLQLRYLGLGILLGGVGAITTNLLIPILFRTSRYSVLGPYFSLLVISFAAHAIVRYRLMDIRIVVRKGVVYVCAIAASASVFVALLEILRRVTAYEKHDIPLSQALPVAILLAIIFQPLRTRIHTSLNRYFYRESFDYSRTIREASRRLSTILELDPLLDYLTNIVEATFKAESVTVYLRHPDGKTFSQRPPMTAAPDSPTRVAPLPIPNTSPLIQSFHQQPTTLVREEAMHSGRDATSIGAAEALQALGGDVALPLAEDRMLVGLIIVGPKRSGDPYFAEDIHFLETLIGQASVATKNAQLYREVVLVNEYIDNILSTMDSGVIAVGASGDVSLFNPAAERLTGLRAVEMQGRSCAHLPAELTCQLRETLTTSFGRSQFEVSITGPDGSELPLLCSTATLRPRNGAPHGALIVFSSLARIKHLEREKHRAERLASLGALASGVAHEIKNPLVAIRTFAELLPERFTDVDFRDDFSKVVIREIARIDDLVGRLRGIAAPASQNVGTFDIRDPIKDTLALLRAQLDHTRTSVHCIFEDPSPLVSVSDSQLKQLFLNLFLNSLEAMGTDGTIDVRIARRDLHGSSWIQVNVSDSGPGIPESLRARIFDPFFTTKPRGSGLGLAICRGITDAHRGTIRVDSSATHSGTTITVGFPAAAAEPVILGQHTVLEP
jgi:PAS domain S-box-containing protein